MPRPRISWHCHFASVAMQISRSHNISPPFPHQTQLSMSSQARRIEHEHEHEHNGSRRIPSAGSVPAFFVPPARSLGAFHAATLCLLKITPIRQSSLSHPTSHQPTLGAMPPPLFLSCPCSHVGDGCLFDLTAEISPPKSLALSCLDRAASSGLVGRHKAPSDTACPSHPLNIADLPG